MGKLAEVYHSRSKFSAILAVLCLAISWTRHGFDFSCEAFLDILDIVLLITCFVLCAITVVAWDIYKLNPADDYNLNVTILQYLLTRISSIYGKHVIHRFVNNSKDIADQQSKLLMTILEQHQNTAYGKDNSFSTIQSAGEFRVKHHLTKHKHYLHYIKDIEEGKQEVLTMTPCIGLATTSGTTGKPKLIPWNKISMSMVMSLFGLPMYSCSVLRKGGKVNLNKMFNFRYKPKVTQSACGLDIGPYSYLVFKMYKHMPFQPIPEVVTEIDNEPSAFYVNAIFALKDKFIGSIAFGFTGQLYAFWQFVIQNIDDICNDIAKGTIKSGLEIDSALQNRIESHLYPDEQRSQEIRKEFNIGLEGLAKRLWPNLTHSKSITTKTMTPQTMYLKNTIMKDILFVTLYYGSTEGPYGIDLSEKELPDTFMLTYTMGYFEFIPEEAIEEDQPQTLLAHQVEVNRRYEMVVTNNLGLYRYRSGDVIQVDSFTGECPVFTVEYRIGQLLNIKGEKTSESVFVDAVIEACNLLNISLINYTATDSPHLNSDLETEGQRNRYILFIETKQKIPIGDMKQFDECLCQKSEIYNNLREGGKFAEMDVYQVRNDTFLKFRQFIISKTSSSQFKMPKVLTQKEHIDFMLSNKL